MMHPLPHGTVEPGASSALPGSPLSSCPLLPGAGGPRAAPRTASVRQSRRGAGKQRRSLLVLGASVDGAQALPCH